MSCISASLVPRVVSSRRAGRSRDDAKDDPRAEMTQPSRRKVVQAAGLGSLFPWGEKAAAMAGSGRGGVASGCTLVLLRGDLKGDAGISARSTSVRPERVTRRWDKHELCVRMHVEMQGHNYEQCGGMPFCHVLACKSA